MEWYESAACVVMLAMYLIALCYMVRILRAVRSDQRMMREFYKHQRDEWRWKVTTKPEVTTKENQ